MSSDKSGYENLENVPCDCICVSGNWTPTVHLSSQSGGLVPENVKAGINYGLDKVRFINPVPSGSKVRVRSTLKEVTEKNPGQWLLKSEAIMEIEGIDKPAYVAETLSLFIT